MNGGSLAERIGHHPEHLAKLGEMLAEHSSLVQQLRHFLAQDRGHTFDLLVAVIRRKLFEILKKFHYVNKQIVGLGPPTSSS
jgi:hypothetical protein